MSTAREIAAYAHMQARLIALLLRHDERRFRQYIGPLEQAPEDENEALLPYRELAVLFHLRDELFEHILPRIVRRLSFESPRSLAAEEPPARGRVHWERSLAATWGERPGEPPLQLQTTRRRRDFATPENLLTVATLLQYRADVQRLLWGDSAVVGADALRHPLNDIVDRCDRALAFPQFAGLRPAAQRILEGEQGGAEALEARVAERASPGGNSAYQELLTWRARRRELRLLRRGDPARIDAVLGADPSRDNYLFQLWIFYELADLLHERALLDDLDTRPQQMRLCFRWGAAGEIRRYELCHDQAPEPIARWEVAPTGARPPGVRPDFYLRRIDPPPQRVIQGGRCYWREPGVVWDAKYYRERDTGQTPSPPVKRMIADLTLLGEQEGVLLFAFLQAATGDGQEVRQIGPAAGFEQTIAPDVRVSARQLEPTSAAPSAPVRETLVSLLERAHQRLAPVRTPACHGVFLDTLSAPAAALLSDRYGVPFGGTSADLLICPKPHIGPWRVDIVSRAVHCCADGRLCHIVGQPGAQKPIRPPRDIKDLLRELEHIFADVDRSQIEDELVSAIARQVEALTRRFAEISGAYRRIEVYFNRLRDLGLAQTLDLLAPPERESLALAVFLVEQLDSIGASDYSAPAIHISSVMEVELKRRVFQCPGLIGDLALPKRQTLGVLPYLRRSDDLDGNWQRIQEYVAAHWNEHPDPDDPERLVRFDDLITKAINRIAQLRNTAAHTNPLPRKEYTELQGIIFHGGKLGYGALNALLLGWKMHHEL